MALAKNENAKNESVKNENAAAGNAGAKDEKEVSAAAGNGAVKNAAASADGASGQTAGRAGKQEPSYTAEEFCSHAQELFQARPECVRAAFMERKVTQCTKAEAQKIVDDFLHKEVK